MNLMPLEIILDGRQAGSLPDRPANGLEDSNEKLLSYIPAPVRVIWDVSNPTKTGTYCVLNYSLIPFSQEFEGTLEPGKSVSLPVCCTDPDSDPCLRELFGCRDPVVIVHELELTRT